MKEEKLVSVIIPVYNVEAYLRKSVESVLGQTYTNLEIILVNDGSTDQSYYICKEYEKLDSRIRVLNKKNGGLSDARNAGLKVVSGSYYYFMDSDDYIEPDLIRTCVGYLEKDERYGLISFNYKVHNLDGTEKKKLDIESGEYDLSTEKKKIDYLYRYYLSYRHGVEVWARMFRGDIIRKHNLMFTDNKHVFAEDICFFMHYIAFCDYIFVWDKEFYNYLKRKDSIQTTNANRIKLNQFTELCYIVNEFYKEHKLSYLSSHCCFLLSKMFIGELGVIWRMGQEKKLSEYIDTIKKQSYFKEKIQEVIQRKSELIELEGKIEMKMTCNGLRYALGGSYYQYRFHRELIRLELKILRQQ